MNNSYALTQHAWRTYYWITEIMKHQSLLFIGLIGVGVVLGATLIGTNEQEPESSVKSSANSPSTSPGAAIASSSSDKDLDAIHQTLVSIQNQLQQEIKTRRQLENKIALLERSIKSGNADLTNITEEETPSTPDSTQSPHQSGFSSQNNDWFNEQAMLDAGVDPIKVRTIKDAFEQAEMDKLYLRDQAKREGWINEKRYTDAAKEIADRTKALRGELNENEYDAYLFAAGRSNRVIVSSTLSTSPASNAGIQPGDTILKYDNKRVYNWSDLTTATSEGSPSDTVPVIIERNGQQQQVYIPRGPLGIRLTTDSVAP